MNIIRWNLGEPLTLGARALNAYCGRFILDSDADSTEWIGVATTRMKNEYGADIEFLGRHAHVEAVFLSSEDMARFLLEWG